jgi:uncharacterized membrane protein
MLNGKKGRNLTSKPHSMQFIREKFRRKKLLSAFAQLFFQGVVLLAPIGVTIWVVVSLFNWVDNFLPNLLNVLFPVKFAAVDGQIPKVTGLGFVVAIGLVLLVGWLSSLFFVERLVSIFDKVLEKTPGIKIIYSSVKDFLEAFAGNKKKFDVPVLVNVDAADVWRIGFITQENAAHFGMNDYLTVYVPHSYAISGITYIVPPTKIKKLPKGISASEAMKYVVSGGVTTLEEAEAMELVEELSTIENVI